MTSQLCRSYGSGSNERITAARGIDCENQLLKFQKAKDKHEIIRKIIRIDFIREWNYLNAADRKGLMDKYSKYIEEMLPEQVERLKTCSGLLSIKENVNI